MRIVRIDRDAGRPPTNPDWFPGTVHQQLMNDPDTAVGVELIAVWFERGSRTKPHVHPVDQVLKVVEGEGVVATETEKRLIEPGDWVVVPAGDLALARCDPDSAMCHVSIKQPGETDWSSPWGDWDEYMEGAV